MLWQCVFRKMYAFLKRVIYNSYTIPTIYQINLGTRKTDTTIVYPLDSKVAISIIQVLNLD